MSSAARKVTEEQPAPAGEVRGAPIPGSAASEADAAWLDGFASFAEEYIGKYPGAFERSPERRALYGDDPEREHIDLETGTHPLLARAS